MTDLLVAKENLAGHTICLCKDGKCIFGDKHGIASMMEFVANGVDLDGFFVADVVVGKAAAMLFVKCGIRSVFAKTLSKAGKKFLEEHGVPCQYEVLVEKIINRAGTDICPMEKTVLDAEDVQEGYELLKRKLESLRS